MSRTTKLPTGVGRVHQDHNSMLPKMSFSFPENVGFRHPLMFPQEVLTYPTHSFHDDVEHLPQILRRASTSITQDGLSVNPHAHREFRSHPLLFVPSFHLVHDSHRMGERGLWYGWCIWRYITSAAVFFFTEIWSSQHFCRMYVRVLMALSSMP